MADWQMISKHTLPETWPPSQPKLVPDRDWACFIRTLQEEHAGKPTLVTLGEDPTIRQALEGILDQLMALPEELHHEALGKLQEATPPETPQEPAPQEMAPQEMAPPEETPPETTPPETAPPEDAGGSALHEVSITTTSDDECTEKQHNRSAHKESVERKGRCFGCPLSLWRWTKLKD